MDDFGQNNEKETEQESQKLSRGQKTAVFGLGVLGILVVGVWMFQFKNNISAPLAVKNSSKSGENSTCSGEDCQSEEERLKSQDTDNDGLNDFEEISIYLTSPYLEDSDSDGYSDKKEIDTDNDPNCPVGRDCYNSEFLEEESFLERELPSSSESSESSSELSEIQGLNANELRTLLIDYGMSADMLNQISDEQLLKTYREIVEEELQ